MAKRNVNTQLNYLADQVESSLYRNGKVFTRRDRDGNDGVYQGVVTEQRDVIINDARNLDETSRPQIDVHGFELLCRPLQRPELEFFDNRGVVQAYYPECAEIVRQATNAAQVFAFDHNVRSPPRKDGGKRIAGGQQVQGPIHMVHGDYTLASAPQRLRDLTRPPGINDTLRSVLDEDEALLDAETASKALDSDRRFAFINVWRNIDDSPVMTDPLALCDGQSVLPEHLVVFEIHYQDRVGENYFAKYSPDHQWWYYPHMTRNEVILIKQWDSFGRLNQSVDAHAHSLRGNDDAPCTFSFHSAFKDSNTPTYAPPRQSIEVRCVALF